MDDTTEKVRKFIEENFLFGQQGIEDGDSFLESGILDSTGILQLIAFLGEEFGIAVGDEEVVPDNLDSIEKVARFISSKSRSAQEGRSASAKQAV